MVASPRRAYFVCATPRSGSTLLCRSLAETGVAGRPEEFFERLRHSGLPREPREYFPPDADPKLLALLPGTRMGDPAAAELARELPRYLAEGTTPNGVFGAKLMWGYFGDLLARLEAGRDDGRGALHAAFGGEPAFVHVSRRDKVAQAVSLWRAVQTRAWSADDDANGVTPVYDARGIGLLRDQLIAQDAAWEAWFAGQGVAPLRIDYETFASDYAASIRRVLEHLGLGAADIPPPPTRRQGDARSDRWVGRFNDEKELG